ncbi:hypothetical protein F5141DRAFT_1063153 [Pisolithus sp. B1]|nr:hypothetical protein F5141DRAFT_1063153 [Pisolithus sp. B1]
MDGGRLPCYKLLHQFRFHPYARIKPSAREIVMAALYDDTYGEERFIPSSSAISDSGTTPCIGRLPHNKLSRQSRFHPYARVKPSAREIVMRSSLRSAPETLAWYDSATSYSIWVLFCVGKCLYAT